jgi:hypothetical protein
VAVLGDCFIAVTAKPFGISPNDSLYIDGGVTQLFPIDYILDHQLKTDFKGVYLFIDLDSRKKEKITVTDGLSLMIRLWYASGIRLSEFQLDKLKNNLVNDVSIIRPDYNIIPRSNPLCYDQTLIQELFKYGTTKGLEFVQKK